MLGLAVQAYAFGQLRCGRGCECAMEFMALAKGLAAQMNAFGHLRHLLLGQGLNK